MAGYLRFRELSKVKQFYRCRAISLHENERDARSCDNRFGNMEISQLDDTAAMAILARFPDVRHPSNTINASLSGEEQRVIAEQFGISRACDLVSEGELARQT